MSLGPPYLPDMERYHPERQEGRLDKEKINMELEEKVKEMEEAAKEEDKARNLVRLAEKRHKREIRKNKNFVSVVKAEDIKGHRSDDIDVILQSLGEVNMENKDNVKKTKKKVKNVVRRSKKASANNNGTLDISNTNSIDTPSISNKGQVSDVDNSVETSDGRDKNKKSKNKVNNKIIQHAAPNGKGEFLKKSENGNTGNVASASYSPTATTSDLKPTSDIVQEGGDQSKLFNEQDVFMKGILEKELLLEEQKSSAGSIMSTKAKEIRKLIRGAEEAEDRMTRKQKEIAVLDARRSQLVKDCDQDKVVMNKLIVKRRKVEEFIVAELEKSKSEMSRLRREIAALRSHSNEAKSKAKANEAESVGKTPAKLSLPPLDYINQKIEAKEKELECPVCFETSSVPIFMCQEFHLICSCCRAKVAECPECRLSYAGRPRRHR